MTRKRFLIVSAAALLFAGVAQAQKARMGGGPGVEGLPGTQSGASAVKGIKKPPAGVRGVEGLPGTQSGRSVRKGTGHPVGAMSR